MNSATTPRDWLLLLFADAPRKLDRVRIQKALFLFAQRSSVPEPQKYRFKPYSYGPFSFEVYPDLDTLMFLGLLQSESAGSATTYTLTPEGKKHAAELARTLPPEQVDFLRRTRDYVAGLGFSELLEAVYTAYPDYATRSVFRRQNK